MNDTSTTPSEPLPVFPTTAPAIFQDQEATKALFRSVLADLAVVVEVDEAQLGSPTPCAGFTVSELRRHILAWLQFFAAALNDPKGESDRLDPETWSLAPDQRATAIVAQASTDIETAIDAGVASELVVMSQAQMSGDGVLAMALGEYLVHGWDLAVATGRSWSAAGEAAEPALEFLHSMVAPEFRGPDSGFFDAEVVAAADATSFEKLLCFGGRQPNWSARLTRGAS